MEKLNDKYKLIERPQRILVDVENWTVHSFIHHFHPSLRLPLPLSSLPILAFTRSSIMTLTHYTRHKMYMIKGEVREVKVKLRSYSPVRTGIRA